MKKRLFTIAAVAAALCVLPACDNHNNDPAQDNGASYEKTEQPVGHPGANNNGLNDSTSNQELPNNNGTGDPALGGNTTASSNKGSTGGQNGGSTSGINDGSTTGGNAKPGTNGGRTIEKNVPKDAAGKDSNKVGATPR